ncbi:uncharacterized protein CLUP02_15472 [Colletotrichum lupini]|uniref:Uncharacterized protein n=1 Tax=Colletotrichum lupini TaxID=145971 RepID=A0A9Q8T660_9PEZI|nr:uncharacterized protein CLUP02_15472 [Colletotrichum lupini]UQC89941.1 hypothetical protein CLUP02_15472 [Colletotrichum lupini]
MARPERVLARWAYFWSIHWLQMYRAPSFCRQTTIKVPYLSTVSAQLFCKLSKLPRQVRLISERAFQSSSPACTSSSGHALSSPRDFLANIDIQPSVASPSLPSPAILSCAAALDIWASLIPAYDSDLHLTETA